jgi:hypothetical protein
LRTDLSQAVADDIDLGDHVAAVADDTLWVLESDQTTGVAAMSAALAWLVSRSVGTVSRLALIARHAPGVAARRLQNVGVASRVFEIVEHGIVPVEPAPHLPFVEPVPRHVKLAEMFTLAGADIVVEYGVVAAEVAGLEVARITEEDGVPTIRIGVGIHDQETFRLMHGDTATVDQLRDVVGTVGDRRKPGAAPHPLNLLARERAMRHQASLDPSSLGLKELFVAEPPVRRMNLKDDVPCCAIGRDSVGEPVVATFASGVNLDLVPFAVDARDRLLPGARVVVVTESRNIIAVQRRIAGLVGTPVEFRGA